MLDIAASITTYIHMDVRMDSHMHTCIHMYSYIIQYTKTQLKLLDPTLAYSSVHFAALRVTASIVFVFWAGNCPPMQHMRLEAAS
jgi:hypothetical protein